MERQVLAAGGVLTLHAPQGFDAETLARLARGIGTERAMGLGEVLLHPRWLRGLQPEFSPRTDDGMATSRSTAAAQGSRAMMPDTPLLRLLARRAGTLEQADRLQAVIDEALTRLAERWQAVRRYLAVPSDRAWGPGASQWGALAAAGARAATLNELREALLGERAGIVSRRLAAAGAPAKPFWDDTVPLADGQSLGLAHWVRDTLGALAQAGEADAPRLDAWQRLCDTVRRQQADLNEAALARLAPRKEAA